MLGVALKSLWAVALACWVLAMLSVGSAGAQSLGPVPWYEAVDQGTGGYPWAGAPQGTRDAWGGEAGVCGSYARWKLISLGHNEARVLAVSFGGSTSAEGLASATRAGEIVDQNPAPGALAITAPESGTSHDMYVEAVNGDTITFSDYNNGRKKRQYSIFTLTRAELDAHPYLSGLWYVHFEVPNPRFLPPPSVPVGTEIPQLSVDASAVRARYQRSTGAWLIEARVRTNAPTSSPGVTATRAGTRTTVQLQRVNTTRGTILYRTRVKKPGSYRVCVNVGGQPGGRFAAAQRCLKVRAR